METVGASNKRPEKLINSCSDIYDGCRHIPKFQRYKEEAETPSTDELNEKKASNVAGGGLCFLEQGGSPAGTFSEEKSCGAYTTQVII